MHAILQINSPEARTWMQSIARHTQSVYLLPIASKPLLLYFVDYCRHIKVASITVVDDERHPEVEELISTLYALPITYCVAPYEDDHEKLFDLYSKTPHDHIILATQPCLPGHTYTCKLGKMMIHDLQSFDQERLITTFEEIGATPISSLKAWYQLNFQVIHTKNIQTLPSYRTIGDLLLGRNVNLPQRALYMIPSVLTLAHKMLYHRHGNNVYGVQKLNHKKRPPCSRQSPTINTPYRPNECFAPNILDLRGTVLLGNFTHVGYHCHLTETIVGNYCAIGDSSNLEQCVILDHTMISPGVHINHRIIDGSRVIDPDTGTYEDLHHEFCSYIGRSCSC